MTEQEAPLAIIRTRPLSQGNYGGILQAYALQQVLDSLGVRSATDVSPGVAVGSRPQFLGDARRRVRGVLTRIPSPVPIRRSWLAETIRGAQDEELARFVTEEIRTVELYGPSGRVDSDILNRAALFVTGSDQVWRSAFGRIPTYLFDFLDPEDSRPRIAYAASFGTEGAEYDAELITETRELALRLTAVSVREASGVTIAKDIWGVDAVHVLDPTMLLDPTHFSVLAGSRLKQWGSSGLVSYVLDQSPGTLYTVSQGALMLGLDVNPMMPRLPSSYREYQKDPERFARLSVESWIASIRDADFVITDSFHGTVFAILFNRPFLAVVNHARGASRFASLLRTFGLENRLVSPGASVERDLFERSIDWGRVNARIREERERSLSFLGAALATASQACPRPRPDTGPSK